MKKLKSFIAALLLFSAANISATPTRNPDGSISCNSGGCTYVVIQNGWMVVCDSEGCISFPYAVIGDI